MITTIRPWSTFARALALAALVTITALATRAPARATTFTVGWEPGSPTQQGVIFYRVYAMLVPGSEVATNRVLLASTPATSVQLDMADGTYHLAVSAFTTVTNSLLSAPPLIVWVAGTNVVALSGRPAAPINLQLR